MESTSRGGETYEEASKRDRRNSQSLMEVGGHVVKEIFGLQEKKKNCWTFFAAAAQVYGGRIHESIESVEMISSYEIRAASIRKKGFRAVFDLQSQGVCDSHKHSGRQGVSHWFCMGLSEDSERDFTLVSVKGVAEGLKGIDSCGAYEGETNGSTRYHGCRVKMKNGEMKQNKKLLEDIAGIAWNCLIVFPSQEGGILRQCPQESPLANGQTLIDGQVLIKLMAGSKTNRRVQVVDGDAHVSVFGDILIQEGWWSKDICVDSLPNHTVLGGVSCLSVQRYKVMLKCNLVKNIKRKSKTVSEIWSMSDFKAYACFKEIMKRLQALLKVELREVRRDKRRQGDAEDEQTCSSIKRCRHKGLHTQEQRESMIFRYFIVDVVDPGSTPDVARCGRELGEQFLSHEQE
ncbi:hypothetical protein YC2023_053161 [Brassica napus]